MQYAAIHKNSVVAGRACERAWLYPDSWVSTMTVLGALLGAIAGACLVGATPACVWGSIVGGLVLGGLTTLVQMGWYWRAVMDEWVIEQNLQHQVNALKRAYDATQGMVEKYCPEHPLALGRLRLVSYDLYNIPAKWKGLNSWFHAVGSAITQSYPRLREVLELIAKQKFGSDWTPEPGLNFSNVPDYRAVQILLTWLSAD